MSDVTRILSAIEAGDPHAAEQLLPLVYGELRRLAASHMAHEKPGQTLDATALVHEAYLRLVGPVGQDSNPVDGRTGSESNPVKGRTGSESCPTFASRGHFFATAATVMRHILIDNARKRKTQKRGGGRQRAQLDELAAPEPDQDLLALDEALQKLAVTDPLKARLVELRYFAGLTGDQAAEVLGISPTTADRHWAFARAWLQAEIRGH
jgi:RNA polymerase sigma factor (sigma-70 family)